MSEAAVWLVLLLALVIANSVALCRSGRARYRPPTLFLTTAAVLVQMAASVLIVVGAWWAYRWYSPQWYVPVLAIAVGCLVVWLILLMGVLRFTFKESVRAGFALGVTTACLLGFALIPLMVVYRTYRISTSDMAPTLCGPHYTGRCPQCGAATVVPLLEEAHNGTCPTDENGICSRCFRVAPAEHVSQESIPSDRILVRRLAAPRRWDLVVFLFPGDRSQIYVKRLVGLPGESIEIKEGDIWINDVRQEPPPEIAGLRWFTSDDLGALPQYATEGNPTRLAENEYFMLGDYSPNSYDSRFWGPVPADDLRGIVAAVYFPPRSARFVPRH
jgi:signal peptidase I